jgi:hypothetical protein
MELAVARIYHDRDIHGRYVPWHLAVWHGSSEMDAVDPKLACATLHRLSLETVAYEQQRGIRYLCLNVCKRTKYQIDAMKAAEAADPSHHETRGDTRDDISGTQLRMLANRLDNSPPHWPSHAPLFRFPNDWRIDK